MTFTDSHTHLYLNAFDTDRADVIARSIARGVRYFALPNIDEGSLDTLQSTYDQWPDQMLPMAGLHPSSVGVDYRDQIEHIFQRAKNFPYYAVGEIGIDLYWDQSLEEQQREAFRLQCKKASELGLPVSIHMRNAFDVVMDELKQLNEPHLTGIFHCFTGDKEQARKVIDMGFYLGIGGVLTFKNSNLGKQLNDIPLSKMVLETDSPYLTPHPYRGQRNESGYLPLIARALADIKQVDIEQVAEKTTANARDIFRF
ncbi:MAG: TatD family hydrolase [Bacteroidales bacterium]